MSSVAKYLPQPSTVLVGYLMNRLTTSTSNSRSLAILRRVLVVIALLNWRALPGVWHIDLWGLVPLLHARIRLRRNGLVKTLSIGRSPFRSVVVKGTVTLDAADWNMHMSNSSYPKALDKARFEWLLQVVGPSMGQEGIWSPLGGTAFSFFKEIPILAKYEIDVHTVSWDEKWIYYVARFTTAPPAGSTERVLHCVALSRSCFKLRGSRQSIEPARVLSVSGLGPTTDNWDKITALRKQKLGKKWLRYSAESKEKVEGWEINGMEEYEEQRAEGMKVVGRFGDVSGWKEL